MTYDEAVSKLNSSKFSIEGKPDYRKFRCTLKDGTVIKGLTRISNYFEINRDSLYNLIYDSDSFYKAVEHLLKCKHFGKCADKYLLVLKDGTTVSSITRIAEHFHISKYRLYNEYYKTGSLKTALANLGVTDL